MKIVSVNILLAAIYVSERKLPKRINANFIFKMLHFCGVCYMCLSIWGIIQLVIMGALYRVESLGLIEDTEAHEFENTQDFIKHTKKNYKAVSTNCFIAAGIYVLILGCSLLCIHKANQNAKLQEAKLLDDKLSCTFEVVELTEKQKKKIT